MRLWRHLRDLWAVLAAVWVAVTLGALLVLLLVASTVLPQASTTPLRALAYWQQEHSRVNWFAEPLSLYQVFSSWLFLSLLILLAAPSCSRLTAPSSPAASPGSSSRVQCERADGAWRPALGVCDIQAGGGM